VLVGVGLLEVVVLGLVAGEVARLVCAEMDVPGCCLSIEVSMVF